MEQTIIIGAGNLQPAPIPQVIHDDQYNLDVYLATNCAPVMDILVPTHGHIDLTIKCLESLYNFTQTPFHLIILDDAPIDDMGMTEKYIREQQKIKNNITYVHSNIHWKCGNTFFNAGLKYSKTEYVVTCMNSISVEPAWEIIALDLMEKDKQIGSIGFKCLFPNGFIESAGIAFINNLPIDIGRDQPGYRLNEIRESPAVQWAFAMHRKKALMGNLDENIFHGHVGWDDIDNSMVIKHKGWKIIYCGLGVGIHSPRATRGSNSMEAGRLNLENAHTFYKRWGLWEQYIEGHKMDVKELIKYETKDKLTQAVTKIQVLQNLIQQAQVEVQALVNKALNELGVSPDQYLLEMNPAQNVWIMKPNPKAVHQEKAIMPSSPKILKPAGVPQPEESIIAKAVEDVMQNRDAILRV